MIDERFVHVIEDMDDVAEADDANTIVDVGVSMVGGSKNTSVDDAEDKGVDVADDRRVEVADDRRVEVAFNELSETLASGVFDADWLLAEED